MAIDPNEANCIYNAACTYAQMGEAERAVGLLERWCREAGNEWTGWVEHDTDLDPIRDDPRFKDLMARVGKAPTETRLAL